MVKTLIAFIELTMLWISVSTSPIYVEDFDTLDRNNWNIEIVANPYNNELQYYTNRTDNIKVECGRLVITPLKEIFGGRQYTSGRMFSDFYWKYGRVEVRAKLPNGFGLWPAIWMLPEFEVYGGWPQSGEIDLVETRGQNNHEISSAIHYGGVCCDQNFVEATGDLHTQCNNDQYHVYSLDWTPTKLIYRLDGNAYNEIDLDRIFRPDYNETGQPFDQHFHLVLNVAIGGNFLDNPLPTTVWNYPDAEMWVDYVKVYPLEDIAVYICAMKTGADPTEVCNSVTWACTSQSFANVSAVCTLELFACCGSPTTCDPETLNRVATAVFSLYDSQLNNTNSCIFNGNAEKKYVLNDGGLGSQANPQCRIKDSATTSAICGAMRWACLYQSFVDVSSACSEGNDVLSCCGSDPISCDNDARLRTAAQIVFQSYYDQNPLSTSCDFGGSAFLNNPIVPLACTDGLGY